MILSIVRVPNGSFSEAYHAFLDHVESDYVLFLSTDDIMTEDHFNRLSLLLKGHPCDILVFDYYLRYLDGFEEWNRANTYSCNGTVLQKMIISERYDALLFNKVFRVDIFRQHQIPFEKSLGNYANHLFLIAYLKYGTHVSYLHAPILCHHVNTYRQTDGCQTLRFTQAQFPEYKRYSQMLLQLMGKQNERWLQQVAFHFKLRCCDAKVLRVRNFDYFLPTPLSLIWEEHFSLRKKILMTIASLLNRVGLHS